MLRSREQPLCWPPLPVLTRGRTGTLAGIEMEKSCSECSEPRGAQSLCTFCNKWLCYQCTDMHQHQKATTTNTSSTQYTDLHQQARPTSTQCPDMHQRGTGSLTTIESGPGLHPRSVLTCHSHRQEPLELICESCDLLCCNSCHLSTHKNHRLVHIGKALQDQQWLFESLVAQVDERRSAVENTAKQIEDRLHGIKIMHRKAENQIKMAKMIMMNELNKRAHLLIEQLEKITEDFQQSLEDQLQGAIETCGQLDHVQRFITWATTQHGTSPVLFSKELISLQMQQLFESSFHQDSWVPVKIKFNWDASYWTKQISTLGELAVEGGDCSYPEGLACPDILKPQPIACLSLPSVCHRASGQGCGYQACCHPQICCMHCIPSKTDMANLEQSQLEAVPYSSSCAQPALLQSQQIQRCCGPASPTIMHSAIQCPAPPAMAPTQLGSSHGSQSRPATPQPLPKPHHRRMEQYSDCQAQPTADSERAGQGQCQGKVLACKTSQAQHLDQTATDREITTEESWEPRWRGEQSLGHMPLVESRDAVGRVSQQGRREYISLEQQQMFYISPAAELRREQQGSRLSLPHTDYRNRRTRSTSLEVSAHDVQSGSSSVCGRRKNRSQSIPAELAASSTSPPAAERPAGSAYTYSLDQYDVVDARQRRASDGVIQCAARETSTAVLPIRGQSTMHLHPGPLLTYKTESDNAYGYTNEEVTKEKYRAQRNSRINREVQKEAGSPRVPMVCLERLKVLVSRLPPHGRRQSDPLPASGLETSGAVLQHRTWRNGMTEGMADGSDTMRPILSHITPPYTSAQRSPRQSTTPPAICELHSQGKGSSLKDLAQSAAATDPKHEPQRYSAAPDLDSDSEPRSGSEELELISEPDLDSEPQLESDTPPESDHHPESSSETEGESMTKGESVAEMGLCGKADILRLSEPRAEYEPDPESDTGMYSDNGDEQDADVESGDAEAESDIQPDSDPSLEADSDILSDQAADSQGSVGSEPDIESEPELTTDEPQPLRSTTTDTDDPQPLRCDQQEGPPIGPGQRPLLIANSCPARVSDRPVDAQPQQDKTEMESEDYCAVCLIGGDLLCCDRCPKVFHLSCHIPPLRCFPTGDWICTLCRDVMRPEVEYDCDNERTSGHHASSARGLSTCDQRKCERLTLLIFSNILSAPFHEPVSPLAQHYYQIVKRPMDLSVIRAKLNKRSTRRYYSTEEYAADVYLMFRNCAKFNYPDSEVAQAGHSLEAFFNSKLKEVFPDKDFPMAEEEPDSDEYDEAYRATENGFPLPDRTEQCHRKRKRRHSVNSKRHQL